MRVLCFVGPRSALKFLNPNVNIVERWFGTLINVVEIEGDISLDKNV